jgi:catechol-2,3-dioxygenase
MWSPRSAVCRVGERRATSHEAIYISDPDGNDLELCWDRPFDEWPLDDDGHIRPTFDDLDLDDLLSAAPDAP